jgi:uncharacterized membrane protein YidH (DUF202 family)
VKKVIQVLGIIGLILFYLALIGMIVWQVFTNWQTVKGWVIIVTLLIIFIDGTHTIIKAVSHWSIIEDIVQRLKYYDPPKAVIIIGVILIIAILLFLMSIL